jgi:transcriptional regulator with XRE-family HTH domain
MKVPWARIERLMNVGGLTWEQAADALGCTTAAMAQWKTGKTGLAPKTLYRLEQKEAELGIRSISPIVCEEEAGEYSTRGSDAEMRRDLREMKKNLAAMDRKVDAMLKRIDEK